MNRSALPLGLLCSVMALLLALPRGWADEEADKEIDKAHMKQIWTALMAYKKARGQLPDHLSTLVPEFLPDKSVLLSPGEANKGLSKMDPELPVSYCYEFSAREFANGGRSFREVKEAQMKEFGPVVPILRCFAYNPQVMNVAYSGDYYESALYWESSRAAKELSKKFGIGPGFDEGDFAAVQVVDDQTGEGVAGAEVTLTKREYHFLPLPDRTLRTDAAGRVRVPLGPAQPPSRRLTVTVSKPGFFAAPETWVEGTLPAEKTWRLSPASTIGGLVQDRDGTPLAGAHVMVAVSGEAEPGQSAEVPASKVVETCITDGTGRWRCDRVAKSFATLKLTVRHAAAWQTEFRCEAGDGAGAIGREALLAQKAELRVEPAVLVEGVVSGPDGAPLANEEVTISANPSNAPSFYERVTRGGAKQERTKTRLKTDAEGRFSMAWQEPAELTLSASPKDLAVAMRTVTVAPGLEPMQLRATARRRIAGQVRDSDGKPVPGARVMFIGWVEVSVEQQVAVTDEKGDFAWDAAPSEQIGLTFSHRGFAPSTEWIAATKKDAVQVELRQQ